LLGISPAPRFEIRLLHPIVDGRLCTRNTKVIKNRDSIGKR
jgi:hypothetical protein